MIEPHFDFDICQRLKNAGFPQPEPADGQIWYNKNGVVGMIYDVGDGTDAKGIQFTSAKMIPFTNTSLDGAVYCPTKQEVKEFKP